MIQIIFAMEILSFIFLWFKIKIACHSFIALVRSICFSKYLEYKGVSHIVCQQD